MTTELSAEELSSAPEWSWLVRPCEQYKDELRECRRWRSRFHQYFIHGQVEDCGQWGTDYNSCITFRQTKRAEALDNIVTSERQRIEVRLSGHVNNDVWENRSEPPSDWNAPLPDNLLERTQGSSLSIRVREEQEARKSPSSTAESIHPKESSSCSIS